MGGDREGGGGRGPGPPPGKLQEEKLVRASIEKQSPPAPVGVVWIRTRMSDGRIFYFHFLHVAYVLKLTDYADAQADLRLCCLRATKSSFSQQGTYGMG